VRQTLGKALESRVGAASMMGSTLVTLGAVLLVRRVGTASSDQPRDDGNHAERKADPSMRMKTARAGDGTMPNKPERSLLRECATEVLRSPLCAASVNGSFETTTPR
jgi:hypothetical protein